MIGLLDRSMQ